MVNMKIMMRIIASVSLFALQGYSEGTIQSVSPIAVKSETAETIQQKEEKESLGAFEELQWETDMDHAFERAKKEHKNVMIMVEEARCKWCKKMKKGALSDQKVQERLRSYILLKVRRSDKETANRIEYFTGIIPSFFFMAPDQEMIDAVIGYCITEDFTGYLDELEEEN